MYASLELGQNHLVEKNYIQPDGKNAQDENQNRILTKFLLQINPQNEQNNNNKPVILKTYSMVLI